MWFLAKIIIIILLLNIHSSYILEDRSLKKIIKFRQNKSHLLLKTLVAPLYGIPCITHKISLCRVIWHYAK